MALQNGFKILSLTLLDGGAGYKIAPQPSIKSSFLGLVSNLI